MICRNCEELEQTHCNYCSCCDPQEQEHPAWCERETPITKSVATQNWTAKSSLIRPVWSSSRCYENQETKKTKEKPTKRKEKKKLFGLIGMFDQVIVLDSWACMPHISGFGGFSSTYRRLGGLYPTWLQFHSIWDYQRVFTNCFGSWVPIDVSKRLCGT